MKVKERARTLSELNAQELREATWKNLRAKDLVISDLYQDVLAQIDDAVKNGDYTVTIVTSMINLKRMESILYRLLSLGMAGYLERQHQDNTVTLTVTWGQL